MGMEKNKIKGVFALQLLIFYKLHHLLIYSCYSIAKGPAIALQLAIFHNCTTR